MKGRRPRSSLSPSSQLVPTLLAVSFALATCFSLLFRILYLFYGEERHLSPPELFALKSPSMMQDFLPAGCFLSPLLLLLSSVLLTTAPAPAAATLLYVSSYSGTVVTLNLTLSGNNATQSALQTVSSSDGCAGSPSWLTLDFPNSRLYCTDEGLTSNRGSVSSFTTGPDGELEKLARVDTISGPVSAVLYGDEGQGLAVAQYGGSSLSWFNISKPAAITPVGFETFTMAGPGPEPSRQDAPHPHEAFLDPKGQFVVVPDLGADLVRVFAVDGLNLTAVDPLTAAPGSGPRHVEFLVNPEGKTYMYLIAELSNTVTGYEVSYRENKTLGFTEVYSGSTFGADNSAPAGASGAEIWISPDGKFLTVSSRNDSSFNITDPDDTDGTGSTIPSDSLNSFSIDTRTGGLTLLQTAPAGGRIPRQFSVNKAGSLVAVGLQSDSRVVIISRNAISGKLGDIVASAEVKGEVTAVIFDE